MKFTVYSKDGCPYCNKIVQVLQLAEQKYVVNRLGVDFTGDEFYSLFGHGRSFPQIVVDDKSIGGCMDTVSFLREKNLI